MANDRAEIPANQNTLVQAGFVLFAGITQLDLTGPYEVLARLPNVKVHLVARTLDPVTSDTGLALVPTVTFSECPRLDVICVPGGPGVNKALLDREVLGFLQTHASTAAYVTSVCSGALVLGAAGLLRGYRAATHWASMQFLESFGAEPTELRFCVDRNRVTGGGVTAGIDFGLYLASVLANKETAERIQLYLEYSPKPPFDSGSPDSAPPDVLDRYRELSAPMLEERRQAVAIAASDLGLLRGLK